MSKVRRASVHSSSSGSDIILSTRTRKSISKSRRSSLAEEAIKPPSRRASLAAAITSLATATIDEEHTPLVVDVHDLYKKKIVKSSQKLNCFFGEPTPVDVCISEIKKEGLKAILESKVPLCYFLYYLLDEFSSENLLFFLEVERFDEHRRISTAGELKAMAERIYGTYISNSAQLQINLDDKVKRNITNQLLAISDFNANTIFVEAKASVYILLESSYIRFLETNIYQEMVRHCGEFTIHYDERTIKSAVSYLSGHLKQQKESINAQFNGSKDSNLSESLIAVNSHYYNLTRSIIERFVINMFGKAHLPLKHL
ncbi:hypothetical protein CU097_006393 [Rhizopus azygosporus]|uniref:RGS domain-containing protein n=1 Tax=Rhizopus azygosporus TaxID=86630 RepID=A0A367K984_RHIAZ|nr:hypothetical protein CU097_006393 [Rhizopus azygosporus]CEG73395.1 hypothetical protein RMATCC62417_08789 [Rhizopus microsporus]CEI86491.1 hypothetical protein RMCBS344292_00931 [Rhizopus microsporus]